MKGIIEAIISILFKSMGVFRSPKTVYFESFHGTQYSDNPKAIYESMVKEYPDYNLVWGVNKGSEKPFRDEKVSYVYRFSFKWFLTMPRACAWVINTRTPKWLPKNKQTIYIQTWHGTPLKKIGCDIPKVNIPGYTKESYDQSFAEESSRWDYLVSPSSYTTEIFKKAFAYSGKLIESGYPRNDLLVQATKEKAIKNQLKEKLNIPLNKKVILYAPTWREKENRVNGKYEFTTDFPFDKMEEVLGEDTLLLVRMHYLVAQNFDFSDCNKKIIDVSSNYDMSELLAISDLLITDYSSCMFDFAITNNPIVFFIPDQEEYDQELRGFYFKMEETMPGPLIENKEGLLATLNDYQNGVSLKTDNYTKFKEKFTSLEKAEASKSVTEVIFKHREE
ncbi:CDP-glycerol glycerophosphotransferase family protein [Vagococcus hydrophili]|uniref:CDP-glycerol glycerophosphotransferase family protein n=1 Tax=Vagococcus hydrophili TaxID=2714947 RepID=A0A6G8AR16_9ENTE|nr:CDP-glycerol glycerophosphotransferase family protein [Vagococcus hydrophili]QIL47437.1 CDP-glycerol glycerophosphotransferase family protein [Vagococcus hydrophili]